MTRPRLIATDLDGTFLNRSGEVSALNAAAVLRAAALGVPFVVATGRPSRWLGVLDQLSSAHPQVIVSNGAAVVELASRKVLHEFPLPAQVAVEVADDLRAAIPGITFGFETGTGFGCEPDSPSRQRNEPGHHLGSLPELVVSLGTVIKLLGFHTELASDTLTALAAPIVGDRLTLTHAATSHPYGMIELTAIGVSKASTLALLCAELGIGAAEVVAFGDMPNDLDMLRWAGRGYVVANCHASLKRAGLHQVAANDADGVGVTVLELLG
jgi:Predicted hydrolases of the HAD superfamily